MDPGTGKCKCTAADTGLNTDGTTCIGNTYTAMILWLQNSYLISPILMRSIWQGKI